MIKKCIIGLIILDINNIEFIIECICDDKDSSLIERETVKKYE